MFFPIVSISVHTPVAASASPAAQSLAKSSTVTKISDDKSAADTELFFSTKYSNYVRLVQSIAEYLPEARPWANGLRLMPSVVFKLHVANHFTEAIKCHRAGDHTARDVAASAVVRAQAAKHDLDLNRLRAEDLVKLLRYGSLFALLVAEDSSM